MDKRTSMGVVGDLNRFTQYSAASAMEKAGENPGGTAGAGMGFGMGMVMANQMGNVGQAPGAPAGSGSGGPPPLPGSTTAVYAAIDGKQAGPFDLAALKTHAQAGRITRDTLVWQQGMANWAKAGEVSQLADVFATVPPPLPPVD